MEFKGNRKQLLEMANKVMRLANDNSPVEILQGILIDCNAETGDVSMAATNFEAAIIVKGKVSASKSGKIVISAKHLAEMLSMLAGEEVYFLKVSPNVVKISSNNCVYSIICFSGKDYPMPFMPFPEETVKFSGICSLAKKTIFATSKDNSKPMLQCVSLKISNNNAYAAACDGNRMILVKGDMEYSGSQEFLLPAKTFHILAAISDDEDIYNVGAAGNEIVFTSKNLLFSIKQQQGNFINTDMIIKSIVPRYTAVANAKRFYNALSLCAISAGTMPINIFFTDKDIQLRCDGDYGSSLSEVSAKVSGNMPRTGFFYKVDYLLNLFNILSGAIKLEIDEKGMMLIRSKKEIYFQMPMNKPVKKENDVGKQTAA